MSSSSEIRQQFIDFFVTKCGHTFVPSSPVVPHDDPTLLFANAGMNQFKDVFLGTGTRPYKRAVDTQKCIRAGGKHNDLDDVGKDTYHHTFFEMLGNWSFGDYFKKEAIAWAWELLTDVWKLDKSRLHVTVFEGDPENNIPRDDEAADCWRAVGVPDSHIHLGNKKDNFWEMGETGPCGPCTEIHYDGTPDKSGGPLVNAGTDKVIEIWNLVFIQFNRNPDKSLTPLPAKHVDTGMGFERLTKILQGKSSNYDTDVFTPLFAAIQDATKAAPYGGKMDDLKDTAYRVIADHIRTLTFALTDGAKIGNVGRDYVLRRILRRAERYGKQTLGTTEPFLHKLVMAVVEHFGKPFPELTRNPEKVREQIYEEEVAFIRNLERGILLFDMLCKETEKIFNLNSKQDIEAFKPVLIGDAVFKLHDTYGIYVDIVEQMAAERGYTVDREGYEKAKLVAQNLSREGAKKFVVTAVKGDLPSTDDSPKYEVGLVDATVLGWVVNNEVVRAGKLRPGDEAALLLDRTNFYAEQGGQVGDTGTIDNMATAGLEFRVEDTQKLGDAVLHFGTVLDGEIAVGDKVRCMQSTLRRIDVMRNHTATHLMNLALRQVLGGHVEQKGSLVDGDKTRFDFSHDKPVSQESVRAIEARVNDLISRDLPVTAVTMPLAEAKKIPGVRAVFGEKYPDPVRVVLIGPEAPALATHDDSVEFCGGTHLRRTGGIGFFRLLSQEAVAKGIRRVTAVTGRVAAAETMKLSVTLDDLTARFQCKPEELPTRVEAMQEELKKLKNQLAKGAAADLAGAVDKLLADAPVVNGTTIVIGRIPAVPGDQVRAQIDRVRQKVGSSVVVFGSADDEGKVPLVVALSADLVKKGLKAGDLLKPVAEVVGGKGGGKPEIAQAGGKDPTKLDNALLLAGQLARKSLA